MQSKKATGKPWPKDCPWPRPLSVGCEESRDTGFGEFPEPDDPAKLAFEAGFRGLVLMATGYRFRSENLLRQAFTRRAFALEYGLSGCGEELEFLGDAILNQLISKELVRQFSRVDKARADAPFCVEQGVTEGTLSKLRSEYVCKERLAARAQALGLEQMILYGTGEAPSDSAREDAVEALIGAVAIDSGWNWEAIEGVVGRIVPVRKEDRPQPLEANCYEKINAWHQRKFGYLPEYKITEGASGYHCLLCIVLPERRRMGFPKHHWTEGDAESRSGAREGAARKAYRFLLEEGLWTSPAEVIAAPQPEDAVNQLQELYQKKALRQRPSYFFRQISSEEWQCVCFCGDMVTMGYEAGKKKAKKTAARDMLDRILGWPAIPTDPTTGGTDWKRHQIEHDRAANIQYLYKLSTWERNWDGEGALPFSPKLIRDVCCAIKRLDEQPTIEPGELCCIRLIFGKRGSGSFLEIELYEGGGIFVCKHQGGKKETHGCELFEIPAIVSEWSGFSYSSE